MDLAKESDSSGEAPYPWKPIIICVAVGQFAIETYVCYRQLKVLRQWNIRSEDKSRLWDIKRTRFRIFSSFCTMLQIVVLIGLDIVPAVWGVVIETEACLLKDTHLPHLWLSQDFRRSAIFMVYFYITFLLTNLPTYFYRTLVLEERVISGFFYGRQNHNWIVHSIAKGRPVASALFFTATCSLAFKIFELKFNKHYVLAVGITQLLFVVLYPILTQPQKKTLSVLEPGEVKDAIEELAAAAKFPLKKAYIVSDQHRQDVRVFGLPRRKYIAIPRHIVAECSTDDIVGLVAHEMGSWRYSNGLRVFCLGQLYFNITWTYLEFFMQSRSNYESFGFKGESYPRMASIAIFTVAFAPLIAAIMGLFVNFTERKNAFIADKYSAELGYKSSVTGVLLKKQRAEGSGDVDLVYSLYFNPAPTVSERLLELGKLIQEKDVQEDGLISLSRDQVK